MAPSGYSGELLAKVNFPPYTVKMLTERHVLIAGGGGKAKTGISNAIEIYELVFDGKICRAQPCTRYETGDRVIMNCTTYHNGKYFVLAAGEDGCCQLYQIKFKFTDLETENLTESTNNKNEARVRHRKTSQKESEKSPETLREDKNQNSITSNMSFDIKPIQRVQTDFSPDDAFQKVVRITPCHKFMVTGGADGHIRFWNLPKLDENGCIEAHKHDIDDLDISPVGEQIVSASRDGHGFIWNLTKKSQECELLWSPNHEGKYRIRNCRFGLVEGDKNRMCLYTSHIPSVRQSKPLVCYLVKWDTKPYKIVKEQAVGTDILSSMAISDDGRFIAMGTMSGAVDIYIAFSLQKLIHAPGVHNIFVTGLEFVPCNQGRPLVTGDRDASVISISVDNQIRVLHVPKQSTISVFWFLLMFIMCLFLVFTLLSYLGL